MEPTEDPSCVILEKGDGWVIYRTDDGDVWRIDGTCNQCGQCEDAGVPDRPLHWVGEPGTPGACIDLTKPYRLDIPMRPECSTRWPACTLSGEYLERGERGD